MSLTAQIAVFLAATVLAVPLFRRLRLSAVLAYLVSGIVIGPFGLRLVTDVEAILAFAEFGVVLLLFIIGLELQPSRLKALRRSAGTPNRVVQSPANSVAAATPACAPRASAWERELIELVLYHPNTLPSLIEHVSAEDIESPAAAELFRLAVELHHADAGVSFAQLMSRCEDEAAKSLLVDCDEQGGAKTESDMHRRLRDLLTVQIRKDSGLPVDRTPPSGGVTRPPEDRPTTPEEGIKSS